MRSRIRHSPSVSFLHGVLPDHLAVGPLASRLPLLDLLWTACPSKSYSDSEATCVPVLGIPI